MQGILYEEASIWQFFLVTCLLGRLGGLDDGRACAQTWRPYPNLVIYLLLLGVAVRFIHHALFNGTMFTPALLYRRHHRSDHHRYSRLPLYTCQPDGDAIPLAL